MRRTGRPSSQLHSNQMATSRLLVLGGGLVAWATAIGGALQMHRWHGLIGQGLCGPWGCAAAPEALLGYHLFLLVTFAPTATLACRALAPVLRRPLAWGLLLVGTGGAGALAGQAAHEWRRDVTDARLRAYTAQRAGFVVATSPDVPVIPIGLSGLCCLAFGGLPRRKARHREAHLPPAGEQHATRTAKGPPRILPGHPEQSAGAAVGNRATP